MSISSTNRKAGPFTGNGTASSFPFYFKVFEAADLQVVRLDIATNLETTLTITANYTVSLNANQDANPGGTVTLTAGALASGYKLTITSNIGNLQPTNLTNQGGFYPDVIEDALDRATIQIQQMSETLDRAVTIPISSTASTALPYPQGGTVIGWDDTGSSLVNLSPEDIASQQLYANWKYDTFTGDGTTTQFTLQSNPGNIANMDVSVSGVTQIPGTDYTLSGTTIAFTTAPALGLSILIRYGQATVQTNVTYSQEVFNVTSGTVDGTGKQTIFNLTSSYSPGNNGISVYLNGSRLVGGTDYTETTTTRITLSKGAYPGDVVLIITAEPINANAVDSAQISYTPSGTGAVATNVQAKLRETVSVKDFGAVGDGVTNDTNAFAAAATYINSVGGGKLIIPAGTYIVGKQTLAGASGLGYSYSPSTILKIQNCTKPVLIEGNGAVLKLADGLHFGSFDPVTGAVYNPASMPFTNYNYAASVCWGMIELLSNSGPVTINDLELDGNISNLVVGGYWGDTGRQLGGYGIRAYGNSQIEINNIYAHHHALDGIAIGYQGLTETSSIYTNTLKNVRCTYNARQGLSWVGGNNLTAIDCDFSHTGKAVFATSPGAGVDVEAESSICRNGTFINCNMENNSGAGFVADSGDSADLLLIRCRIIGTTTYAIWPRKPRISFTDCLVAGAYVNPYYSTTNPEDATRFTRCKFTDETKYGATLYGVGSIGSNLSATNTQNNVIYDTCTFITTRSRPGAFAGAHLIKCTFNLSAGTGYINSGDYFILLSGSILDNCTFNDNITVNQPANAYYASMDATTKSIRSNYINSTNNKLFWWSYSPGGGGAAGYLGNLSPSESAPKYLSVIKGGGASFLGYYGTADTYWGTAAPTSGTYKKGDRFFNSSPAVGSPKSWVCTAAGTPGTWVSEGNL